MNVSVRFESKWFNFSYEGPEDQLQGNAQQFVSEMLLLAKHLNEPEINEVIDVSNKSHDLNLAQFLSSSDAATQISRFLATAVWLQHKGNHNLTTSVINEELRLSKQQKLSNAADCLSKNITYGFCERSSSGSRMFFVTQSGMNRMKLPNIS